MPRGERFYYRHKAKVIDGTRCNGESNDVCVDGQCQVSSSSVRKKRKKNYIRYVYNEKNEFSAGRM